VQKYLAQAWASAARGLLFDRAERFYNRAVPATVFLAGFLFLGLTDGTMSELASALPGGSTVAAGERVLVLDFGSQFAQLIARRVREQNVYCEIVRHNGSRR
jgi:hypothetical protein